MYIAQTYFESLTSAVDQLPWLAAIWFCFLGGCIGSFLNVVVYRVPTGMSLVHPGSHCPVCHHAIRIRDNIPVLGWLLLKGRCRDCQAAISARYPVVEAIVAVAFLILWWVDVDQLQTQMPPPGLRLSLFGLHACLVATMLCASLIDFDGHRVPAVVFLPCLIAIVACSWGMPPIAGRVPNNPSWFHLFLGSAFGAVIGLLADPAAEGLDQRLNRILVAALSGAVVLPLGVATMAVAASVASWLARRNMRIRRSIWLFAISFGSLAWIVKLSQYAGSSLSWAARLTIVITIVAIYAAARWARRVRRSPKALNHFSR